MSISKRLRKIREDLLHFKQRQGAFATTIGISQQAYSKYETGDTNIPNKVLYALSTKYQVNLNWLITGEGDDVFQGPPSGSVFLPQNDDFLRWYASLPPDEKIWFKVELKKSYPQFGFAEWLKNNS